MAVRTRHVVLPLLLLGGIAGVLIWRGRSEPEKSSPLPPPPARPEDKSAAAPSSSPGSSPNPRENADPGPRGGVRVRVHADGLPLVGAKVKLTRENDHESMDFQTEDGGWRTILNLPPGDFHVKATHPGYAAGSEHFSVGPNQGRVVSVALRPENVIFGTVRDVRSKPLSGATLTLVDGQTGGQPAHAPNTSLTSDEKGEFRFTALPPGAYGVRARVEGLRMGKTHLATFGGVGERREVHIVLEEGGTMAGKVIDDLGRPVANAAVCISNEEVTTTRTNERGEFRVRGLGAGAASGFASAEGYATGFLFGLRPGQEDLVFGVRREASFAGRLEASPRPPGWMLRVEIEDPKLNAWRLARQEAVPSEDDQNRFELQGLEPGNYRVTADAPGYECPETASFKLEPGEKREGVVLRLRRSTSSGK